MPTVSAANPPYTGAPTPTDTFVPTRPFDIPAATPEAFGAGVGRAVSQLGQTFGQAGNEFAATAIVRQDLVNNISADAKTNQYMEAENKLLYGDPTNPNKPGLMQLHGKQFTDAWQSTWQQL